MRYLKSQLKVRSVFLESDMRIRWLAFVTNLALDFGDASWRPVPYRESFGEHGRVIEFALERLDYWSIIVVKTLSQM
ncbi:MAG TPA: hypothetical protein DDZ84_00475 [Firmicutes bacterium]|nr:hypothetical protein [Bacillota bacterium]